MNYATLLLLLHDLPRGCLSSPSGRLQELPWTSHGLRGGSRERLRAMSTGERAMGVIVTLVHQRTSILIPVHI